MRAFPAEFAVSMLLKGFLEHAVLLSQNGLQMHDNTIRNTGGRKIHLFYTIFIRLVTLCTVHADVLSAKRVMFCDR
jgi:hypothetical protein